MTSGVKDFPDNPTRLQQRDDEIGCEMESYERRDMQDPEFTGRGAGKRTASPADQKADPKLTSTATTGEDPAHQFNEYDEPPVGPLIEFEDSCLVGRGDLLHLAVEMIRPKS